MSTPKREDFAAAIRSQAAAPSTKRKRPSASKRFATLNAFVDSHMRDLSPTEANVFVVLWRNERAGLVEMSHGQIGDVLGMKRRAVINAVNQLIEVNLIRRVKRGNTGGATNQYQLRPPT